MNPVSLRVPELQADCRTVYVFTKRSYRHARRKGLWESVMDLGHFLLEWLLQFTAWSLLASILAVVMIESIWDNDQIDWWRNT